MAKNFGIQNQRSRRDKKSVGYGESLVDKTEEGPSLLHTQKNAFDRYSYVSRQSDGHLAELTQRGPQEELLSLARSKVSPFLRVRLMMCIPFLCEVTRQRKEWDSLSTVDQQRIGSLDHILAMYRKLREGLTAARSKDAFTITVYEESVDVCLDANNFAELHKSLAHLLQELYPASDTLHDGTRKRQEEMAAYYFLYRICHTKTNGALFGSPLESLSFFKGLSKELQESERIQRAMDFLHALVANIDFVKLSAVWNQATVQQKKIIESILPETRKKILHILTKSFFTLPTEFLLEWLLLDSVEDLVALLPDGSLSKDDGIVTLRRPKRIS